MGTEGQKVQSSAQIRVERVAGALGAEVFGLDLSQANATMVEQIQALLIEYKVLFFPRQNLSVEQHVALGEHFGTIESHPNLKNPFTDYPGIFELAATQGGVADEWHTDITFQEQPSLMSILHMVKCPEVGGDTMWSSLEQSFTELSEPMQAMCESLTALHDALPHNRPDKMTIHPVVRVHPVTGRKSLYVNEHFTRRIVELSATESEVLLNYLTGWVKNPRFTVRYRWQEGTIAMWDNRCTQHFVLNDFEGERIVQRVTVMGDEVHGAQQSTRYEPCLPKGPLTAMSRHDRQLAMYLRGAHKGQLEASTEAPS